MFLQVIQRIAIILVLASFLVTACGQAPASQPTPEPTPLTVIVSTSIVADVVRQIGGERVRVETIVPVGADGHNYEPLPQDLARLNAAQVIFTVGAGYEEFIERLIASSGTQAEVIALSEGLNLRVLAKEEASIHSHADEHGDTHADEHGDTHADEHGDTHVDEHGDTHADEHGDTHADEHGDTHADEHGDTHADEHGDTHADEHAHGAGAIDGHTWTDPNNVKVWANLIASTLSRIDPAGADMYTTRAADYQRQLDELDRWIAEQVATIPPERRLIVADHIIFGYMADRYGLRQIGAIIPGVSTSATPSAQELAALQDLIANYDVKVIFVGDIANQQLAEQIARDTGVKIVPVLTESLTDENGPGATYIDYMRYNVQQIVAALRG
ncbi:MAG: zinc ABC transporter substrate-binding protein [Chloroflexus sp.]